MLARRSYGARLRRVLSLLAVAVLAGSAILLPGSSSAAPGNAPRTNAGGHPRDPVELVGRPAPETKARPVVGGGPVDVAAQRGQVQVLAFVATWCAACRTVEPLLAELHASRRARGLRVVAYSHEPRGLIDRHYTGRGLPFPVAQCTGRTALRYAATALPTVVAVDRSGIVRDAWQGAGPALVTELRRVVDRALAGP